MPDPHDDKWTNAYDVGCQDFRERGVVLLFPPVPLMPNRKSEVPTVSTLTHLPRSFFGARRSPRVLGAEIAWLAGEITAAWAEPKQMREVAAEIGITHHTSKIPRPFGFIFS